MENVNRNILNELIDNKCQNLLKCFSANEWISKGKEIRDPKPLFGTIWSQGEVGILFSDTGQGKSVLGIQIADSISSGKDRLELNTTKSGVLYLDCELTTKSFQRRYTDDNDISVVFADNFYRAEIDMAQLASNSAPLHKVLIKAILNVAMRINVNVIIIDNISFLSESNEKSKDANLLMKEILRISREFDLAILIIAHTPKREFFKAFRIEDLAGSKALANFCDVAFCIGPSIKSSTIKYIKELKNRNNPVKFHDDNVIVCEMDKSNGYLRLNHVGFSKEKDHVLNTGYDNDVDEESIFIKVAKKYKLNNVEIANILGVSEKTIRNKLGKDRRKCPSDSEG